MLALICAALVTYRLAVLIAEEEGPFEVATRFRNLFLHETWVGRGVRCPACVSFWAALPATMVAIAYDGALLVWLGPFWWLAVAGAARWLWRLERDDD